MNSSSVYVSTKPGCIEFTLIFSGPSSQAPALANNLTPPCAALNADIFVAPIFARIEDIITMEPPLPCLRIASVPCFKPKKHPSRLVFISDLKLS